MKTHLLRTWIGCATAVAVVALQLNAQPAPATTGTAPHLKYAVIDMGAFGGNFSQAFGISDRGHIGAGSTLADGTFHAALWTERGGLVDLGTLGGPNSAANTPNLLDELPIQSETSAVDPYNENFCMFFTNHLCEAAVWRDGHMRQLTTLGGNNAEAWAVNNFGEVAGFSETAVKDGSCASSLPSQVFQYQAVTWDRNGRVHELRPLHGDSVGFGFAINDWGQVVGASGQCGNTAIPPGPNAPHAVLWGADGRAVDLGSLSGTAGAEPNVADSINDLGEVVGGSRAKDGTIHPFLWTRATGMLDLGTFPGAVVTVAGCCNTNNNRGQIVGFSIDGTTGNSRAFLWQNWHMIDLNTLISPDSGWYLQNASSINDEGEIAGSGLIDGNVHGFLAVPCDRAHARVAGCQD